LQPAAFQELGYMNSGSNVVGPVARQ